MKSYEKTAVSLVRNNLKKSKISHITNVYPQNRYYFYACITKTNENSRSMKKVIYTNKSPEPIGPYSQAIESNGILYISGQIGIEASTGTIKTDIEEQYRQVFINVGYILEEAGYSYADVVRSTVFINDMNNFGKFNSIYSEYFSKPFPARSVVEASALPKGALVEMEIVAVK